MTVSAFLGQVDIGLIPYKEFMTAISGTEFRGVCLVTVTKHYPMETTAYQHGYRSVRTISYSTIQHPFFILVNQSSCQVASPCGTIYCNKNRRLYC